MTPQYLQDTAKVGSRFRWADKVDRPGVTPKIIEIYKIREGTDDESIDVVVFSTSPRDVVCELVNRDSKALGVRAGNLWVGMVTGTRNRRRVLGTYGSAIKGHIFVLLGNQDMDVDNRRHGFLGPTDADEMFWLSAPLER